MSATPGSTQGSWREVDIFVPDTLSSADQASYLDAQIRAIAHDGGEFVHGIAVRRTQPHTVGWKRCHVAYLSGPPGMLD